MSFEKPKFPDAQFASRFASAFPYGFYIAEEGDTWEDVIGDPKKWVILNLNPREYSCREPFATSIVHNQNRGVTVESHGQLIKLGHISGSCGHLPNVADDGKLALGTVLGQRSRTLVPDDPNLDLILGLKSGFYKFHVLRHLFNHYGYLLGKGHAETTMHFMNFRDDQFYIIEPKEFTWRRSARRGMLYDYDISFDCIGESAAVDIDELNLSSPQVVIPSAKIKPNLESRVNNAIQAVTNSVNAGGQRITAAQSVPVLRTVERLGVLAETAVGLISTTAGAAQRSIQNVVKDINSIVEVFGSVTTAYNRITDARSAIVQQLRDSVNGAFVVASEFDATMEAVREDYNELMTEAYSLAHTLLSLVRDERTSTTVQDIDNAARQARGQQGFTTDLSSAPVSTSTDHPLFGQVGLDLVMNTERVKAPRVVVYKTVASGMNIEAFALQHLGDASRWLELVLLNDLEAPYIVASPLNKPPGTVAWGETLAVPQDAEGTDGVQEVAADLLLGSHSGSGGTLSGNQLTLAEALPDWRNDQWFGWTLTVYFDNDTDESRVVISNDTTHVGFNYAFTSVANVVSWKLTPTTFVANRAIRDDRVYGADLLVVFGNNRCRLALAPSGDLAVTYGLPCLIQGVMLIMATQQGTLVMHPSYGTLYPIGNKYQAGTNLLYSYVLRRSLLSDKRITEVQDVKFTLDGDTLSVSAQIGVRNAKRTQTVRVSR